MCAMRIIGGDGRHIVRLRGRHDFDDAMPLSFDDEFSFRLCCGARLRITLTAAPASPPMMMILALMAAITFLRAPPPRRWWGFIAFIDF